MKTQGKTGFDFPDKKWIPRYPVGTPVASCIVCNRVAVGCDHLDHVRAGVFTGAVLAEQYDDTTPRDLTAHADRLFER